jgi:hypothetical protein
LSISESLPLTALGLSPLNDDHPVAEFGAYLSGSKEVQKEFQKTVNVMAKEYSTNSDSNTLFDVRGKQYCKSLTNGNGKRWSLRKLILNLKVALRLLF